MSRIAPTWLPNLSVVDRLSTTSGVCWLDRNQRRIRNDLAQRYVRFVLQSLVEVVVVETRNPDQFADICDPKISAAQLHGAALSKRSENPIHVNRRQAKRIA